MAVKTYRIEFDGDSVAKLLLGVATVACVLMSQPRLAVICGIITLLTVLFAS